MGGLRILVIFTNGPYTSIHLQNTGLALSNGFLGSGFGFSFSFDGFKNSKQSSENNLFISHSYNNFYKPS